MMTTGTWAPRSARLSLRSSTYPDENGESSGLTNQIMLLPCTVPHKADRSIGGRKRGTRVRRHAAIATSCGILSFYVIWRLGLTKSILGRMQAISASCVIALGAMKANVLGWRMLLPSPPAATSQRSSLIAREVHFAPLSDGSGLENELYSVRRVALPPRTGGHSPWHVHALATGPTAAAPVTGPEVACSVGVKSFLGFGGVQLESGPVMTLVAAPAGSAASGTSLAERELHGDQQQRSDEMLEVHLIDMRALPTASALESVARTTLMTEALSHLASELGTEGVIGLDAEWEPELRPGVRHRISVIQLASANRCWILQPGGGGGTSASTNTSSGEQKAKRGGTRGFPPQQGPTPGEQPVELPAAEHRGWLPREVVRLLSDPRVIKAGLGIQEDVRRLECDFGVQVHGAVDVRLVAQQVAPRCLTAGGSLQALSAALLGRTLDKSAQRSHWGSAGQLAEGQIAYAAHDAWLSRELLCELHCINQRAASLSVSAATGQVPVALPLPPGQLQSRAEDPPRARQTQNPMQQEEQGQDLLTLQQQQGPGDLGRAARIPIGDFVAPFLDAFNGLKQKRMKRARGTASPGSLPGGGISSGRASADHSGHGGGSGGDGRKPVTRQKEMKLPTRKSVLYENCRLLAPDGAVLCTCGAKKVAWYLQRGLARVISENPTTIQLKFEPRGRGHADDEYYLSDKENRCCVCGSGGEYLRHSVVPHCYRQHFPPSMKSHLSHDIVLMCPPCHKTCSVADQKRMTALGRQFNAPLGSATAAKFRHDSILGAVRSAGRALANTKVLIPPPRRRELEDLLRQHFGVQEMDEALVRQAANVDPRMEDENWRSHAELVVRALGGRDRLEAFVRGWRQHFLDTMRPQFMPNHWRVDARVANSSTADEGDGAEEGEEGADRIRSAGGPCGARAAEAEEAGRSTGFAGNDRAIDVRCGTGDGDGDGNGAYTDEDDGPMAVVVNDRGSRLNGGVQ
ncbi:hypothetical protein Vretimale_2894 [Volvox reticuliferus]|uniref:Uncharacterized protein n=1 Tax=Volvox reticuliferus TaxID=1737510 RepID=A0A8J4FD24_9CHLO|nr:hypothetical protein Vretifemale_1716 [Volvox reticuliferus]GIL97161.1 hypothetical protein Vretimale_2894 [Volvox reticuliferus]